jgi:hypothetical protein
MGSEFDSQTEFSKPEKKTKNTYHTKWREKIFKKEVQTKTKDSIKAQTINEGVMKEEEDRREDHQLLEVKTLTEEIIKMIKTNLTKVAEILNMKMVQKDSKQISRIIKVDIRKLNSHQDQLSLS